MSNDSSIVRVPVHFRLWSISDLSLSYTSLMGQIHKCTYFSFVEEKMESYKTVFTCLLQKHTVQFMSKCLQKPAHLTLILYLY